MAFRIPGIGGTLRYTSESVVPSERRIWVQVAARRSLVCAAALEVGVGFGAHRGFTFSWGAEIQMTVVIPTFRRPGPLLHRVHSLVEGDLTRSL
jgi:hypothetical protein